MSHGYVLTPWCRVLEKLTGLQLVKKFPAFHGTRRFITALTSVRHLSLSWASPIQSIYPHLTSWRSILIYPSTPRSPQWSFSLRFPHQDPIHPIHESWIASLNKLRRNHSEWADILIVVTCCRSKKKQVYEKCHNQSGPRRCFL